MKHAHTISWAIFALLGAITVVISLTSLSAAYLNPDADLIGGRFTPAEVANGDEELAAALSARRGTAAAFGLSYGILLFGIAWGPYRKARPPLQVAAHREPGERRSHPAPRADPGRGIGACHRVRPVGANRDRRRARGNGETPGLTTTGRHGAPAWNAGFSRHALRDSAAHGAAPDCGRMLSSVCAPGDVPGPRAVRRTRSRRPRAYGPLCRLKPAFQAVS